MPFFGSATLVMQGPGGKVRFEIAGERTSLGRTRDNELVLNDPAVSSHHCEFVAEEPGLVVYDLQSSNGTYVNGRRVERSPVFDGDAIRVGQYQGRIAVRRADGRPLRQGGSRRAAGLAAGVILLAMATGGVYWVHASRVAADQSLFAEFDGKASALLKSDPCGDIGDQVTRLAELDVRLEEPQLGRLGRLTLRQRRHNETVLALSRKREGLIEEIVSKLQGAAQSQRTGLAELRGYADRFHAESRAAAARGVEQIFAERGLAGEQFAEHWRKHGGQVSEYNGLLSSLLASGDREAARQLDGYRFKYDPLQLLDDCRTRAGKTQLDGLHRLAEGQ